MVAQRKRIREEGKGKKVGGGRLPDRERQNTRMTRQEKKKKKDGWGGRTEIEVTSCHSVTPWNPRKKIQKRRSVWL